MEPTPKVTTTETLPAEVRERFEFTEPLEGGPKFAFPSYGQGTVDFSTIELPVVEALVKAGFPYLREKPAKQEPKGKKDLPPVE
jgi:hypothetical protein